MDGFGYWFVCSEWISMSDDCMIQKGGSFLPPFVLRLGGFNHEKISMPLLRRRMYYVE